jgi:pimeloyl-ACP methyl ester carboxylesterase
VNQLRGTFTVSIGLLLQSAAGDAVIAIRGTVGIYEWIHDAMFLSVHCPFLPSAGSTEDGFTAMYMSMTTTGASSSPRLAQVLAGLPWPKPFTSLTICGHSLGGALATLLALDVAANTTEPAFKDPRSTPTPAPAPAIHPSSTSTTTSFPTLYASPIASIWCPSSRCPRCTNMSTPSLI